MSESAPPPSSDSGSSTGLDSKLAGVLCYLLGFVSGILFILIEKQDRDVRFHAYQSTATFLSLFVLNVGASIVPLVGWIVALVLPFVIFVVWVLLMVKAFQGVRYKLPVVGDWAEESAG